MSRTNHNAKSQPERPQPESQSAQKKAVDIASSRYILPSELAAGLCFQALSNKCAASDFANIFIIALVLGIGN